MSNNATQTIDNLKANFSGQVVLPGDADYEQARLAYGQKECRPAVVLRAANAQDVAAAVAYAAANKLVLSVRGGGHSSFGSNDGGVVIDLSLLDTVGVLDGANGIVRIGGGATWGAVAAELQKHGLGISSGDTKSVGVGGLTLYGGIGWMVRGQGLALDSLVAVELVTAAGEVLRCSADENPDLFWAVRGGGGNFGVAVSFEFKAHETGQVYAGSVTYTLDNLLDVLKAWRDCMRTADKAFNSTIMIMPAFGPGMTPFAKVMYCYAADDEAAAKQAVGPLLQAGTVTDQSMDRKAYPDVLEEAHAPEGIIPVVKNMFVRELDDELLAVLAGLYANPAGNMTMLRAVGGAMNDVAPDATAFAHRDAETLVVAASFVPQGSGEEKIAEALKPWQQLAPFAAGAYANFFTVISDEDRALVYPETTYKRLAVIKKRYDPDNLFNQNCNVEPA